VPGGVASDTLTINVPQDASSGEQYAVLWAQVSTPSATDAGITLVNRVGVRMYLSIGAGGAPPPNFTVDALAAKRSATGEPLIVATVHNTGKSTLELSGQLQLTHGPGGLGAGPFTASLGTILAAGISEPVTVQVAQGFPRGPWRAELVLKSGLMQRSTEATVTFPFTSRSTGSAKPPRSHAAFLGVMALVMVLVITAAAFEALRRRKPAA
jgi:hypothetical protein